MKECFDILDRLHSNYSYQNIYQILESYGAKTSAEYLDEQDNIVKVSYADMCAQVRTAAGELGRTLREPGSFVGLKLENSPVWPVMFWATLMAGYCPLLLDVRGEPKTTLHLLDQAGAVAVITEDASDYPGYEKLSPATLLAGDAPLQTPAWADKIALCTSGTTGTARVFVYDGVAMSHQLENAKYFLDDDSEIMYDTSEGPCKNLGFLPFHHIFGLVAVYLWYSFFGKTIVYLRDKNPATILEACRRHEVTHVYCVPMFWNNVAQGVQRKVKKGGEKTQRNFERVTRMSMAMQRHMEHRGRKVISSTLLRGVQNSLFGSSIRFMISGGGHIPAETLQVLNSIGYPLHNGFGMTETGITSVDFSLGLEDRLQGSVGVPFHSVRYEVNEQGELFIGGESLYTGQMVDGVMIPRDKSQLFPTGDIARLEDGRLFIEGRLKEVIINESGENIYPDELEDYFTDLPGVERVCVMGIDNGGAYEEITMVLTLEPGCDAQTVATLCELINEINGALPMYKKLRRVLVADAAMPVANGIKVQRQKLKKMIEHKQFPCRTLDIARQRFVEEGAQKAKVADIDDQRLIDIKNDVRKVFADVLILNEEDIGDFSHFVTDLGGDSLAVVGVIAQLEEKYKLFIPDAEFARTVNVQEIAELIYSKLYDQPAAQKAVPAADEEAERVSDFTKTAEYAALERRFQETMQMGANPYFVAHDSTVRDTSLVHGQEVINLGSYNYLGMSGHPETVAAAVEAVKQYGTSASGSRVLAGEKTLYQQLEQTIAQWKHAEDAIVLTGGWATNVAFIGFFCHEGDLIVYDALSHNSIVQGCQLSTADSKAFPHNDIAALEHMLRSVQGKYTKVLIVVEGVYSMDGDIAPIPEFVRLKKQYGAFLMVDEAHSSGVIGAHGGGVDDYFGLAPTDIDVKMGTLSKALGTCGGYIAGSKALVDYLKYSMPGFVFTAGISPPLAAAAKRAVELIQQDNALPTRLHDNIAYFIELAKAAGVDTCLAKESAIVPVMIGEDSTAFLVSDEMLKRGVFVPPAVFPAVPRGQSRLRFSISASHNREQLRRAVEVLTEVMREQGLLK